MSKVNAEYFAKLQKALARAGLAEPVLVIDSKRLDANIRQLKSMQKHSISIAAIFKMS